MDTIKNYLETMFQNMPNTAEVKRAKYELGQMMEDKYTELKNEGKSENEAIGIVISEFGNLDELALDLGISDFMKADTVFTGTSLSMDEVKDYIKAKTQEGFFIGIGVLLCICSPCGIIISDTIGDFETIIGLLMLFLCIAAAVGLFVFSGGMMQKWSYLKKQPCTIDFATANYVHNQRENYRMTYTLFITVGVILCVLCFVPLVIMDSLGCSDFIESIGVSILLILIGLGVCFFISAGNKQAAYDTILKLNSASVMGGNFVRSQMQGRYSNKTVAAIMSIYWPTVTCIYLCWSFISMDWHITWIIWVIAGLINTFITNAFSEQSN